MKSIEFRNSLIRFFYQQIFKRIFFNIDPETVHDKMVVFGNFLGKYKFTRNLTSFFFSYNNSKLSQNLLGMYFNNPIGLAAGFDKNAHLTDIIANVGFGFSEIGSITGEQCSGNPKPRLWRLIKSRSLLVYYGLKNDGCEIISKRLEKKRFNIPIGVSIAKTNSSKTVELSAAVTDYMKAYKFMSGIGSYHVVNISCPNAYGGEPFTDPDSFRTLMNEMEKIRVAAPLLVKLSPDLSHEEINKILEIAFHHGINGVICSNLTKDRSGDKIVDNLTANFGGISGKILEDKVNEQIGYIYKKTKGQMIIIGCGGVFSAEDAYKKIRLGASLIQLITGMIFEGPQLASEINHGLVKLLERDGFNNISEVIGIDNRF